jgi:hypothetical protein
MREHLVEYLERAEADMDSDIVLPKPKMFEVASFVGGVVGLKGKTDFPALSIDAYNKIQSPSNKGLYEFRYDGHVTGMVAGTNPKVVEQQAKGYGAAIEMFIKEHTYQPYDDSFDASGLPFAFLEFGFIRSEFFGAANTEVGDQKGRPTQLWVDGFRIEIAWITSEAGPGQPHG